MSNGYTLTTSSEKRKIFIRIIIEGFQMRRDNETLLTLHGLIKTCVT